MVEVIILTVRWLINYWFKKKRENCRGNKVECTENKEKYERCIAGGFAIETKTYVKCLIQAGIGNGFSFGFSVAGGVIGALIPLPGAAVGFSILFGFIGYVAARFSSGAVIDILEKVIEKRNGLTSIEEKDVWCKCMKLTLARLDK